MPDTVWKLFFRFVWSELKHSKGISTSGEISLLRLFLGCKFFKLSTILN
jgi:hypothetical protein